MSEVRDEYIRALYDLSKADPARWTTFVEAFKEYMAYEFERSLSTPTADIAVAFGHSRCLSQLRNDFVHVETLMTKLKRPHGAL